MKHNDIFDILVEHAGANQTLRSSFINSLKDGTPEFRFQGSLGFGGKYYPRENMVSCYSEDRTPLREEAIDKTNAALKQLKEDA